MSWRINQVETDGLLDDQPALTPGESDDFDFLFQERPAWEEPDDHIQRFTDARQLTTNAGDFYTYESIQTDIYWKERDQAGQSPLVRIDADSDDPTAVSIWGLIESVDADTSYPAKQCVLTLSILFIAPIGTGAGEFETEADIRAARHTRGP